MEEMFVRAILGQTYESADETVYRRVVNRVSDYVQRSTGIQTIHQMHALVEMVREFGYVPENIVKPRHEYKRAYLAALMERVRLRVDKLERGELEESDLTIKGAVAFLRRLRDAGVTLILASGTDHEDVVREAQASGYAHLFDGGIFGAVGDIDRDTKREVIRRIFSGTRLSETSLVCFGYGPVELREAKKRGAIAVGVASDEVRRYGLNPDKRSRLIRAGADAVAPDFSQPEILMRLLGLDHKRRQCNSG